MNTTNLISSGLSGLVLFFLISSIIERIVEITTGWWIVDPHQDEKIANKRLATFLLGSIIGIVICFIGKLNIFNTLGIEAANAENAQSLYYTITGIAMGSGTQFLHEWIALATRRKQKLKKEQLKNNCEEKKDS